MIEFVVIGWVINYIMLLCWIRLVSAQRTTTVSNLVTKERRKGLSMGIYNRLKNEETKIAVIGLGYVGLLIALEFAKTMSVIGFNINKKRVDMMKNNIDPSEELNSSAFENCDKQFTALLNERSLLLIKSANTLIWCLK